MVGYGNPYLTTRRNTAHHRNPRLPRSNAQRTGGDKPAGAAGAFRAAARSHAGIPAVKIGVNDEIMAE